MTGPTELPQPPAEPTTAPRPAPRRNRTWIWYFVIVTVLAVGAAVTLVVYNLNQQLTTDRLQKARALWEKNGPSDYEFKYTSRGGKEDEVVNRYHVVVRGKKVEAVTLNGQIRLPAGQLGHHSMDALFDFIEDFIDLDEKAKRKVFELARFDAQDGHLLGYARRVTGTSEHQKITLDEFRRLAPKSP